MILVYENFDKKAKYTTDYIIIGVKIWSISNEFVLILLLKLTLKKNGILYPKDIFIKYHQRNKKDNHY